MRDEKRKEDLQGASDLDQWIDVAAQSSSCEEGFGVRGCDLSQAGWWAAYTRQSTEEQRANSRLPEYLLTCAREAQRPGAGGAPESGAEVGLHRGRHGVRGTLLTGQFESGPTVRTPEPFAPYPFRVHLAR